MGSIYGNSIKPNDKSKTTKKRLFFYGKWVGGYRGGLVLEVRMLVNASGMLRMPDQPMFWKSTKPGNCYFSEKTVFAKMMCLLYQNDKPQKRKWPQWPRQDHVFIKIWFCDGSCQSITCFSREPGFAFFCTANSFHHEIMFWLEGAEVEGSYFKQKNYHPSSPWCCLINSVNSMGFGFKWFAIWVGFLNLFYSDTVSRRLLEVGQ